MKTTIRHIFLVIVFLIDSDFLRASQIIDWIGSYHSDASPWVVTVHEDKPPVFGNKSKGLVSVSVSPSGWLPHTGWFVLIEDDTHLWAYDGLNEILLCLATKTGNTVYDLHSLPALPPKEVLDHLPKAFRETVLNKFRKIEAGAGQPATSSESKSKSKFEAQLRYRRRAPCSRWQTRTFNRNFNFQFLLGPGVAENRFASDPLN